jgi:PIN like domain
MIIFFDRDVGTSLPKALIELHFDRQFNETHYHQQHFPIDYADDIWMPQVGSWGWTIIGHDSQHHIKESEISAIKQYNIGCFYLWGSEAKRWEKMQCFARAYERIIEAEKENPRPFIFKVSKTGALTAVPIP